MKGVSPCAGNILFSNVDGVFTLITYWSVYLWFVLVSICMLYSFFLKKKNLKETSRKYSKDLIWYYTPKGIQMPHKHKIYSTLLIKMHIKISDIILYLTYWQKFKSQMISSVGNGIDLQKMSQTAGENMWQYTHLWTMLLFIVILSVCKFCDPAIN